MIYIKQVNINSLEKNIYIIIIRYIIAMETSDFKNKIFFGIKFFFKYGLNKKPYMRSQHDNFTSFLKKEMSRGHRKLY